MNVFNVFKAAISGAAIALSLSAMAQEQPGSEHRLQDHPAVTIKRLSENQGYDYASKFYPHPAWLHLYLAPPNEDGAAQEKHQAAAADAAKRN